MAKAESAPAADLIGLLGQAMAQRRGGAGWDEADEESTGEHTFS